MEKKMWLTGCTTVLAVIVLAGSAWGHCQIPCGIYGDQMRFDSMREHVTTIEKSMRKIVELGAREQPEYNQLVRWVTNKEEHASKLNEIVTFYFMAQRVAPVEDLDSPEGKRYTEQITLLHRIMVEAMKAKQTTDQTHVQNLRDLITEFEHRYMHGKEHAH